jgi:prepilin-type N-terminal cleavage/methylation domain-containing protein
MKYFNPRIASKIRAFTIIELLVVIAIIALLAGIITSNFTGAKAKSRDGKRVSDIGNIQASLTYYFDRCNKYPTSLVVSSSCTASSGDTITLSDYISVIPLPPSNPSLSPSPSSYDYLPSNGTAPTDFILHTKLEQPSEVLKDSLPDSFLSSFISTNSLSAPAWNCYDASTHPLDYCLGSR